MVPTDKLRQRRHRPPGDETVKDVTRGAAVPINHAHQRYMDLLFDRAAPERYPSHHLLQRLESDITDRETAERYVDMLLSEAERHRYPSFHMIDRARRIMMLLAAADLIEANERSQQEQD